MSALGVGDGLYGLTLLDPQGVLVDLSAPTRTGRSIILWLRDAPPTLGMPWLADMAARLAAIETALYCVLCAAPPGDAVDPADLPVLVDPERTLARAAGLEGPGLIVLGADQRVVAVLSGDDPHAALAVCAQAHGRTAAVEVAAQAPAHMVRDVFEPDLCVALIAAWEAGEKRSDMVAMHSAATEQAQPDLKRRADVAVNDSNLLKAVRGRIERRLVPEILRAFQYRVRFFEGVRVGCYDSAAGGYFRRHRDNTTSLTASRRFAVSINLNTGDYEGGQVRFPEYGQALYSPPRGGAVVFSCALLHEALPVTAGRRFGAFTFAFEPAPETAPNPAGTGT
ncbi:MAG: 2OG-Fe(II) oxygenase family protein [Kiloniellaceae bacterium]